MGGARGSAKILFLGQCLQYGYAGVSRYVTYPNVAAAILTTQFPGLRLKFDFKYLYHPTGLKALLQHRLLLTRPDIAVIALPAMFAATAWRVNMVYQIAPELVDTARSFVRKIEMKVKGVDPSAPLRDTLLDKTFAVKAPLTLDAYEREVEDAMRYAQQISDCRFVLMGPGGFNEDTYEDYENHSPELWEAVNQMILRVTQRLNIDVVNVQDLLGEYGGEVFMPNNHRFSPYGHEVVGREVASVLARQITTLRLYKQV